MSSSSDEPDAPSPFTIGSRVASLAARRQPGAELGNEHNDPPGGSVFRIGGSIIPQPQEDQSGKLPDRREGPGMGENTSAIALDTGLGLAGQGSVPTGGRTIRFPDESPSAVGQTARHTASPEQ